MVNHGPRFLPFVRWLICDPSNPWAIIRCLAAKERGWRFAIGDGLWGAKESEVVRFSADGVGLYEECSKVIPLDVQAIYTRLAQVLVGGK